MRLFLLFISFSLLLSCSSDDANTSTVIGTWKLSQVLSDPGDGSGTFMDVNSNKSITFLSDDTFSSNGNFCFFSSDPTIITDGVFSTQEEKIYPNNCDSFAQIGLSYKLENGALIINYPCIEACAEKYMKLRLE